MKKSSSIIIFIIILLLIIAGFYASVKNSEKEYNARDEIIEENEANENLEILNVKHQYKDGEHIVVGTIDLPTPCHELGLNVTAGNPEIIEINISEPGEDEACIQVITPKEFVIVSGSPEDTEFGARIDGQEYRLNVFEIPEDQDIFSVEIFIKG